MTAEEILVKAAELVERPGGWCQHALATREGANCAMAAVGVADADGLLSIVWVGTCRRWEGWRGDVAHHAPVFDAMAALAREVSGEMVAREDACEIVKDWNNAPEREQIEVAAALRNAKRWL